MKPTKVCPVVLRMGSEAEILAFRHPLAGLQLVKGTIEPDESPDDAALRELAEESGLVGAVVASHLGVWNSDYEDQVWSFYLCEIANTLPDEWIHHTSDDGGHDFRFFWHPLSVSPTSEWHEVFHAALIFIRTALV